MQGEDDDIRNDITMRMEDFNVLKKTTSSRLSVYEARIDMLEQLVLEYSQKTTEPTNSFFEQTEATTVESLYSRTTEAPDPTYDELGGNDFSMLGINNPKDLDILVPYSPKKIVHNCLNPPCDQNLLPSYDQSRANSFSYPGNLANDMPRNDEFGRSKRQQQLSPVKTFQGQPSLPPPLQTPRPTRKMHLNPPNKNNLPEPCDCEKLRVGIGLTISRLWKYLFLGENYRA